MPFWATSSISSRVRWSALTSRRSESWSNAAAGIGVGVEELEQVLHGLPLSCGALARGLPQRGEAARERRACPDGRHIVCSRRSPVVAHDHPSVAARPCRPQCSVRICPGSLPPPAIQEAHTPPFLRYVAGGTLAGAGEDGATITRKGIAQPVPPLHSRAPPIC